MRTWLLFALLAAASLPAYSLGPAPFLEGQGKAASFRGFEDDNGGFYLVWAQDTPGQPLSLYAQHINAKSELLWGASGLQVTDRLALAEDWSGLADGQGGLTLFWDEKDGVHAQRFRPAGTRRRSGDSVRVSSSTAIQPDAVPDAQGGTLIVWRQNLPGTDRTVLMAQRLDSEGRSVWPAPGIRVSLRASRQTN